MKEVHNIDIYYTLHFDFSHCANGRVTQAEQINQ